MTTTRVLFAAALLAAMALAVFAQNEPPTTTPGPPGETMPSWIFWWLVGIGGGAGLSLTTTIGVLWRKLNAVREQGAAGLTPEQNNMLVKLHELVEKVTTTHEKVVALHDWHNVKDENGLHQWILPRSLGVVLKNAEKTLSEVCDSKTEIREIRATHAQRIETLRGKIDQGQEDRREEMKSLMRENQALLREVMTTATAMSESLGENSREVARFREIAERLATEHGVVSEEYDEDEDEEEDNE